MKRLDVCGMGNGLVDILVRISEQEFTQLGYERGTMRLVEIEEQKVLLERLKQHDAQVASGGSVANSTIAVSQLGGRSTYLGCLGDDRYGIHFKGELEAMGVEIANWLIANQSTGTCVALITPDGERTMRTSLGVCTHLAPEYVNEAAIRDARWLFIEGYLFSNPGGGQDAIRKAVLDARKHGTKVAVTFSEAWVVSGFGAVLREVMPNVDLVFANETEACAYTGTSVAADAFKRLSADVPSVVVTAGAEGAFIAHDDEHVHVPAFPCRPLDLTGAGDMFAGAFLYGITHNMSARDTGRAACYLAREVITRIGPRLAAGTKDYWNQGLAAK